MLAEGIHKLAIRAFERNYRLLLSGETGMMPSSSIQPVSSLPDVEALPDSLVALGRTALKETVIIKLNGGLGTSMGLKRAKSLLKVKGELSFLDLIARQAVLSSSPLLLMNSFSTQTDSMRALSAYPELKSDLPQEFLQHKVPKIDRQSLSPVEWPVVEETWCPPGHGDLYTAMVTSGVLKALRAAGKRYAFISNSDNLGAVLDLRILGHFAQGSLPFLMEVADRTQADRKGGHLALREGQLILREAAQCPEEDLEEFQNIERHRYFNTNTIWLNLEALEETLEANEGLFPLPLICNSKSVNPRDPSSTPVYQLESAMGSAIGLFKGAQAIRVPRSRFVPVKSCADLLRVRSDATLLTKESRLIPSPEAAVSSLPLELDPEHFKFVTQIDQRFPKGPPSLQHCTHLKISGDVRFGADVICVGRVELLAQRGEVLEIKDGTVLS